MSKIHTKYLYNIHASPNPGYTAKVRGVLVMKNTNGVSIKGSNDKNITSSNQVNRIKLLLSTADL